MPGVFEVSYLEDQAYKRLSGMLRLRYLMVQHVNLTVRVIDLQHLKHTCVNALARQQFGYYFNRNLWSGRHGPKCDTLAHQIDPEGIKHARRL